MAKALEDILAHISQDRRGFLKTLLVGSAVAAVPVAVSQAVAPEARAKTARRKRRRRKAVAASGRIEASHQLPKTAAYGLWAVFTFGAPVSANNPRLHPAILISPVEGGYVAYDPGTDKLHQLNPTAALIVELCDGSRSASDIGLLLRRSSQRINPTRSSAGSARR